MHLGQFVIDQVIVFAVNTHDPDPAGNGDAIDADSAPTYRVYEQETGTPILTGSMAKLDDANTLGFYSKALTLSAANGLEVDKCYTIRVLAVVGTVEQVKLFTFNIVADVAGDIPAIKAKTDGLPSDPADASVVAGLIAALEAKVDAIDTIVDSITARLPAALGADGNMKATLMGVKEQAWSGGSKPYDVAT